VKNAVFWDVTPCGCYKRDVSEGCIASIIRLTKIDELGTALAITSNQSTPQTNTMQYVCTMYIVFLSSVLRLLFTADVPSSSILVTLMMEAIRSSETSVLIRATRCNIPEDYILPSHRRENLKSFIALTGWSL
jgi:hypothetical protein